MDRAERKASQKYTGMRRSSKRTTRAMELDMSRASANINKSLAGISGRIGAFGKAKIGGGIVAGLTAITAASVQTSKSVARIGNEAALAGVNVTEFQKWSYVADQNRISIDAMSDGLKEMQLRADEFIQTGKGPAAEAFARIGYGVRDLEKALKDPSELLLEIIRRTKELDQAAQIRVADELFGGTAAEQFSLLIRQGDQAVRDMMSSAEQAGAILDENLIEKAAEVDRRFEALKTRVSTFAKTLAVETASAVVELADFRARLDEIFPNEAEGRAVLGNDIFEALDKNRDALDQATVDVEKLRNQYSALGEDAGQTAAILTTAANQIGAYGYDDLASSLVDIATEMRDLSGEFQAGQIDVDDFGQRLQVLTGDAYAAFDALDEADRVDFAIAISQVDVLSGAIASLISFAASARAAIAGIGGVVVSGGAAVDVTDDKRAAASRGGAAALGKERQARKEFLQNEAETNALTKEQLRA